MYNYHNSIFSRNTLFAIVLVSILCACANKDKVSTRAESSQKESELSIIKVSTKTKLFLADYRKELKTTKQELNSFDPSKDLIEKYSLVKLNDNKYYIKGLATFDDKVDKESLSQLGIKVGSKLGNHTSLHIPLNKFEAFLQKSHITYFEIAEKAQLKK